MGLLADTNLVLFVAGQTLLDEIVAQNGQLFVRRSEENRHLFFKRNIFLQKVLLGFKKCKFSACI